MSTQVLELPDGKAVSVDDRGYLLDWRDWSPAVAEAMAGADGVTLQDEHWQVLDIFREYYSEYEIEPPMRALVRLSRERFGAERGGTRLPYRLFPDGPGTQACRYAGLPKPLSCV
jgi:tRNA 2-thiouridine synthesizing protein E